MKGEIMDDQEKLNILWREYIINKRPPPEPKPENPDMSVIYYLLQSDEELSMRMDEYRSRAEVTLFDKLVGRAYQIAMASTYIDFSSTLQHYLVIAARDCGLKIPGRN
jgi:hypothetical protein